MAKAVLDSWRLSYECTQCQRVHYQGQGQYDPHFLHQSMPGVASRAYHPAWAEVDPAEDTLQRRIGRLSWSQALTALQAVREGKAIEEAVDIAETYPREGGV